MINKVVPATNYPSVSKNNDNTDKDNKKKNKKQEDHQCKCQEPCVECKCKTNTKGTRIDVYV